MFCYLVGGTLLKQLTSLFSEELKFKTLAKFALLIFLTEFVRGAYMGFFPLYSRDILGNNNIGIYGTVFFAYFFVETISKIIVGWILDRFNNKIMLLIGLGISFLAFYALKFITSPILLIIDGAFIGFGFAPVWLIVLGHISSFTEEKRSSSIGIIYAAWLIGLGLGTVSITLLISKSFTLALNMMILCWLAGIIIAFFVNEGIKSEVNKNKKNGSTDSVLEGLLNFRALILKGLLKVKHLLPGMILQTLSITMLTPILSVYFTGPLGLTKFQYGLAQIVLGITTVACLIVLSRFTKMLGVKNLFLFGLLFAAIGIFAVGHSKNLILILIFGIMIGVSYSAILPSWYTIMSSNVSEKNNGLIWGLFSTLEGLGRALGPLFGGFIAQYYGMQFSFSISAFIMFGLAMFYFVISKKATIIYNSKASQN